MDCLMDFPNADPPSHMITLLHMARSLQTSFRYIVKLLISMIDQRSNGTRMISIRHIYILQGGSSVLCAPSRRCDRHENNVSTHNSAVVVDILKEWKMHHSNIETYILCNIDSRIAILKMTYDPIAILGILTEMLVVHDPHVIN